MPRRKFEGITYIYWLIDVRTGDPFYCGKTVRKPAYRLGAHFNTASRRFDRALSHKLRECSDNVAIQVIDVVPVNGDWAKAEREWIAFTHLVFSQCVNVARGGEGAPGNIHSQEWKDAQSKRMRERIISPATREKMAARLRTTKLRKGKLLSPEGRAKLSLSRRGRSHKPHSEETKHRISAAQKGRPLSPEHVEALREAWKRRKAKRLTVTDIGASVTIG